MPPAHCLRIKAFWASKNRDAFMTLRSSQSGIGAEDSNQNRSSLPGADQSGDHEEYVDANEATGRSAWEGMEGHDRETRNSA